MSRSLAAACAAVLVGISLTALAPPPRGECGVSYRVVRGDTLTAIARRCGASVAAIARASGLANPDRILVGQRLVIPGRAGRDRVHVRLRPAAASYAMTRGDTLFSLARWANVSLASLMAVNPGIDPHRIEIGDRIRLPAGARDPVGPRRRERGGAASAPGAAPTEPAPESTPARRDEEEGDPVGM